jgi:hypothetical protein
VGIVRLKPCYLTERKRAEQAFKQKHDAEKVSELLSMFNLPHVSTKGYQTTPRPELTGGSASGAEAAGLHAFNELLRWTIAAAT